MKCFGDSDRIMHCKMMLLDEQEIVLEIQETSLGQVLLEAVHQHLNLIETSYFGLRYIDASNQTHWLDPNKKVCKQLKGENPFLFYFSVKFYAADPTKLVEEVTRYQFFLQVKQDILQGRLPVSMEMAAELGALAVQSELGDFDPRRHSPGYVSEFRFLPNQSAFLENQIEQLHKKLIGQVPLKAEYNYLEKVKWLDMYGVDLHPVLGEDSTEYFLGITPTGLIVLRNKAKAGNYFWPRISKVYFRGKFFMLRVKDKNNLENTYGFETPSKGACKHLWRCCVEHHAFFRLTQAAGNNPQAIFSLSSKFRYSGRTETEIQQEAKVKGRSKIEFSRSPSRRYQRRSGEEDEKTDSLRSKDTRNVVLLPSNTNTMPPSYHTTSPTPSRLTDGPSANSTLQNPYYGSHRESRTTLRDISPQSTNPTDLKRASSVESQSSSESRSRRHRRRRRSRGRSSDGESETSSKGSSKCHRRHRHRHRHSSNDSTDSKHRRRHHRHSRSSDKMVESSSQWAQIQEAHNASRGHTATIRSLTNGFGPQASEAGSSHRSPRRRHRTHRSRSRSPSEGKKKTLPEELRRHIEFDLKATEGLSESQLKEIPYTKIETARTVKIKSNESPELHNNTNSTHFNRAPPAEERVNSWEGAHVRKENSYNAQRHSEPPGIQQHQTNGDLSSFKVTQSNGNQYPMKITSPQNYSRSVSRTSSHGRNNIYSHENSEHISSESPQNDNFNNHVNRMKNGNRFQQQMDTLEYDQHCSTVPLKPQPSPQSSVTSGISMGSSSVSTTLNDSGDADNSDSAHVGSRYRDQQLIKSSLPKRDDSSFQRGLPGRVNSSVGNAKPHDPGSNTVSHVVIKESGKEPRYISYVNSRGHVTPPLPPRKTNGTENHVPENTTSSYRSALPPLIQHPSTPRRIEYQLDPYNCLPNHPMSGNAKFLSNMKGNQDVHHRSQQLTNNSYQTNGKPNHYTGNKRINGNFAVSDEVRTEL